MRLFFLNNLCIKIGVIEILVKPSEALFFIYYVIKYWSNFVHVVRFLKYRFILF